MKSARGFALGALLVVGACHSPPPAKGAEPRPIVVSKPRPQPETEPEPAAPPVREVEAPPTRVDADGLEVEMIRPGSGALAELGTRVSVHYVGALLDGTPFDSSRERGTPFEFELGKHHVIEGFERGVQGMRVGEIRRLTIPPSLGYGDRGAGGKIPPKATLVFEIELLAVK